MKFRDALKAAERGFRIRRAGRLGAYVMQKEFVPQLTAGEWRMTQYLINSERAPASLSLESIEAEDWEIC